MLNALYFTSMTRRLAVLPPAPLALTASQPYTTLHIYDYTPCGGATGTRHSYYYARHCILFFTSMTIPLAVVPQAEHLLKVTLNY